MKAIRGCPFCGSTDIHICGYDFGRSFTEHIDIDTECVMFECDCGCRYNVPVTNNIFLSADEMTDHAIDMWNKRAGQ